MSSIKANRVAIDLICELQCSIAINQETINTTISEGKQFNVLEQDEKLLRDTDKLNKKLKYIVAILKNYSDNLVMGIGIEETKKEIDRIKFYVSNGEIENYERL
jgi:hypothetical protein